MHEEKVSDLTTKSSIRFYHSRNSP